MKKSFYRFVFILIIGFCACKKNNPSPPAPDYNKLIAGEWSLNQTKTYWLVNNQYLPHSFDVSYTGFYRQFNSNAKGLYLSGFGDTLTFNYYFDKRGVILYNQIEHAGSLPPGIIVGPVPTNVVEKIITLNDHVLTMSEDTTYTNAQIGEQEGREVQYNRMIDTGYYTK